MEVKTCSWCGQEKPVSEFSRDRRNKRDGYRYICKECVRKKRRENFVPKFVRLDLKTYASLLFYLKLGESLGIFYTVGREDGSVGYGVTPWMSISRSWQ